MLTTVVYHYVRPLAGSAFPGIKGLERDLFERQLDYLRHRYVIVSADDVLDAIGGIRPLPDRAALLTFDDGLKDHYQWAFPALARRGLSGAFFPVASAVRDRRLLDVHKIQLLLAAEPDVASLTARAESLAEDLRAVHPFPSFVELRSAGWVPRRYDAAPVRYVKNLLQSLLPPPVRSAVVSTLFAERITTDERAFADEFYVSAGDLRTMADAGMHLGGHSDTHGWLNTMSETEQAREIDASREMLDAIGMSRTKFTFCPPFGRYDDTTLRLLDERGCMLSFTVESGVAALDRHTRLETPRFDTNEVTAWMAAP